MKATGIVRRIDDLGRIVIPKEIRRTLRIKEGDPLEIFTDRQGEVIFKKYSPLGELGAYAKDCCSALSSVSGMVCAVCDTDSVIAYSGAGKREVLERGISHQSVSIIEKRQAYFAQGADKGVPITNDSDAPNIVAASPIISEGDIAGMVAFLETPSKKAGETEQKLLSATAMFLGKQLEN